MQDTNTHDAAETTTDRSIEVVENELDLEVVELEDAPLTDVNFGF